MIIRMQYILLFFFIVIALLFFLFGRMSILFSEQSSDCISDASFATSETVEEYIRLLQNYSDIQNTNKNEVTLYPQLIE